MYKFFLKKKENVFLGRHKYDQEIYEMMMDSFDNMPLACLVDGKFFCLHGGISPEMKFVLFLQKNNKKNIDY